MKPACFFVPAVYFCNGIFNTSDREKHKNACLEPFCLLKRKLLEKGYDLCTQDINPVDISELVIFFNMPAKIPARRPSQSFFLLAYESEAILPRNFDKSLYHHFDRIFTWHDRLVDGKKVIKINYAFILENLACDYPKKDKLVCLVAANKTSRHPSELYSERIRAIRYFEQRCPEHFDLYGPDWDILLKDKFGRNKKSMSRFVKALLRCAKKTPFENVLLDKLKCYRGMIPDKTEVIRHYSFSICYENVRTPGYITEKLFDSFFARCVPIYHGAPNVREYIPENTFIAREHFGCYDDLYEMLVNVTELEYIRYLNNIRDFLESDSAKVFSAEHFSETIFGKI